MRPKKLLLLWKKVFYSIGTFQIDENRFQYYNDKKWRHIKLSPFKNINSQRETVRNFKNDFNHLYFQKSKTKSEDSVSKLNKDSVFLPLNGAQKVLV